MWKNQMVQFVNEKYYTKWYLRKNYMKKKTLKTFVLLENNHHRNAPSKEKTEIEYFKLNISWAKYEYLQNQK